MIRLQGYEPPPNPPKRSIDWGKYLNISCVTLKDAVALSCGLSPLEIFDVQRPIVFKYRLEATQRNLSGSQTIELIEESESSEFSKVSLASFAQFSREMNWGIPMEMEMLLESNIHDKGQCQLLESKGMATQNGRVNAKWDQYFKNIPKKPRACYARAMDVYCDLYSPDKNKTLLIDEVWDRLPEDYPFNGNAHENTLIWAVTESKKGTTTKLRRCNYQTWMFEHLR